MRSHIEVSLGQHAFLNIERLEDDPDALLLSIEPTDPEDGAFPAAEAKVNGRELLLAISRLLGDDDTP